MYGSFKKIYNSKYKRSKQASEMEGPRERINKNFARSQQSSVFKEENEIQSDVPSSDEQDGKFQSHSEMEEGALLKGAERFPPKFKEFILKQHRKRKPYANRRTSWVPVSFETSLIILFCSLIAFGYYHRNSFHYGIAYFYASLGYPQAQYVLGQRFMLGTGVKKNKTLAMEWFKKAAAHGHVLASYNLAVGHLNGIRTGLKPGEALKLIKYAARKGVPQAKELLDGECSTKGNCDY